MCYQSLAIPALSISAEQLKIRVDDDVAVYQNGQAIINSHDIAGWQWTTVYDAELTADVLVLTAFNQVSVNATDEQIIIWDI